jgi:BMFP domain-containing protein YqiC
MTGKTTGRTNIGGLFLAANRAPLQPRRTIAIVFMLSKRVGFGGDQMVQTTNRFFDEVARLMNDAAGVAQGVRREFETLFRTQAERFLSDMDLVKREDFEAVKDMARIAREENEALKARLAIVEADVAKMKAAADTASAPPAQTYGNDTFSGNSPSADAPSGGSAPSNPDQPMGSTWGPSGPGSF